ncbi:MAG TPA: ABC transporter substrate-binding protein [Casimicrobiaceae bacterium]|nr:ABC transporter substrate-binding protein [Casimicrobiaceae bacterium]
MDRRTFLGACASGLVLAPAVVDAQSAPKIHRVGFLLGATAESVTSLYNSLNEGLRDRGYIEGRNLILEARYGGGKMDRLPDLAAELVRMPVEVIVTGTRIHVAAVRSVTKTVPTVMVFTSDPVAAGFVESLAHPGGNVTGLSGDASPELWTKYLALLREAAPKLSRVGALGQVAAKTGFAELEVAARQLGIALEIADLKEPDDVGGAFAAMASKRVDGVVVIVGPLTYQMRKPIGDLALKYRLPTICTLSEYAHAGALMTYGPNLNDLYLRAASYVDKILRGAKPADLPVEQPSRFELTVNLKTAKALGVNLPHSLQLLAAEVID